MFAYISSHAIERSGLLCTLNTTQCEVSITHTKKKAQKEGKEHDMQAAVTFSRSAGLSAVMQDGKKWSLSILWCTVAYIEASVRCEATSLHP